MQIHELEYIIDLSAEHHYAKLQSSLRYKCIRAPQSYRLWPDCSLKNLWEEICVQIQSDKWEGFYLVESYLLSEIEMMFEALPSYVQFCLSYEFSREEKEVYIDIDSVKEKILKDFYQIAINHNNQRIEKFLW